jgi:tetraacyldisaccharide 4'-kinase
MNRFSLFFTTAPRFWDVRSKWNLASNLLWPISKIYGAFIALRQLWIDARIITPKPAPVPLIIVGNIRVGGTGKTPLVIALAKELSHAGWHPAIVSRGYVPNQRSGKTIAPVDHLSNPSMVGDEPVLMAQKLAQQPVPIPIWVGAKRNRVITELLKVHPQINVIICDDGLQSASLIRWPAREGGRDLELVVRDERGEGNRRLLPAGPLREPAERDRDATLTTHSKKNGVFSDLYFENRPSYDLTTHISKAYQLIHPEHSESLGNLSTDWSALKVKALAAIGNPKKFFTSLIEAGIALDLKTSAIALPDHGEFSANFFQTIDADRILITEKDAVKCSAIDDERIWVVPLELKLPNDFIEWVSNIISRPNPYAAK